MCAMQYLCSRSGRESTGQTQERPSFLKKRSKKHLLSRLHRLAHSYLPLRVSQQTQVFWFFFSKNNIVFFSLLGAQAAHAAAPESCFHRLAATRNFTLGAPREPVPTPDGRSILFLRSLPRDTKLGLYDYDLATHAERALAKPDAGPEHLSVQEKALRERTRMTLTGITGFALSDSGSKILVSQGPKLAIIDLPGGASTPVPGDGWIAPILSPDGTAVAGVRDNDVHVVELATGRDIALTTGGTDIVTHGLVDFAAAEELERATGLWWSPDGAQLLYEVADSTGVERHFIADPEHPQQQPTEFRYPRAGTDNAKLRFGLIARNGGPTTWIDWDHDTYPYLARAVWRKDGKLTLVLLTRAQTKEVVVTVDPATGKTSPLLTETDSAWLNVSPEYDLAGAGLPLPYWLKNGAGFLWAAERGGLWQLELHHADGTLDRVLTPRATPFIALNDVDEATGSLVFTARPSRIDTALYRVKLGGGAPVTLDARAGLHSATAGHDQHAVLVDQSMLADGSMADSVIDQAGKTLAILPSIAEKPPALPNILFTTAGNLNLDALLVRPAHAKPGARLPVILSVYAGPGVKNVERAPIRYLEDQCMADAGFAVVTLDGRGTPGRDRDFERATKYDLIDLPLQDQIDGLQAMGHTFPELDLSRAGVTGWSFGGYFTAMATIRRPDIFKAGVAGAPVVDFADYDTAYTERYLGLPQTSPDAYAKSNVLTYADKLARPLLIMHGLTDDNVYFENTVKLTQALIQAGKPYNLLLLPGTHLLPDPLLRTRVSEIRVAFLKEHLK
jgi:dipeptidyl-peptidase-4